MVIAFCLTGESPWGNVVTTILESGEEWNPDVAKVALPQHLPIEDYVRKIIEICYSEDTDTRPKAAQDVVDMFFKGSLISHYFLLFFLRRFDLPYYCFTFYEVISFAIFFHILFCHSSFLFYFVILYHLMLYFIILYYIVMLCSHVFHFILNFKMLNISSLASYTNLFSIKKTRPQYTASNLVMLSIICFLLYVNLLV